MGIDLSPNINVISFCPICSCVAQKVHKMTVQHQILPDTVVNGEQFHLCRNPKCEVAYFSLERNQIILQEQLLNKIWFKDVPSPVPICYCLNVTDEDILNHVAVAKCCSTLEDIQKHTRANTGRECLTKNPAGG